MTPDWAPNIHPLIVHFPIALLVAAVVTDLLSVVMPRRPALREAATWLYCAGAGSAVAAYLTGSNAADSMLLPAEVTPLVDVHDNWAFRTTALFALLAAARVALPRFLTLKAPVWWGALALALIGTGMLYQTAERGGQLVFQHGLGVQAITTDTPVEELLPAVSADQVDPGPIDLGDGSWVWRPVQGADAVLAEQFTWIENRPEGLPAPLSRRLPVVAYRAQVLRTPHSDTPNSLAISLTETPCWKLSTILRLLSMGILRGATRPRVVLPSPAEVLRRLSSSSSASRSTPRATAPPSEDKEMLAEACGGGKPSCW